MRDAATVASPVLGNLLSFLGSACWGCLPQTQEIFFSIHSPTLGLGFSYQEPHSIGRYWRRTWLYFPWEICLADFLAACYRTPGLSQWNNKCLLSSCFAWLWAQSWGCRESTELLARLGGNLLFPAHHLQWDPLTLMSARTTPKIPRTKHSGDEPIPFPPQTGPSYQGFSLLLLESDTTSFPVHTPFPEGWEISRVCLMKLVHGLPPRSGCKENGLEIAQSLSLQTTLSSPSFQHNELRGELSRHESFWISAPPSSRTSLEVISARQVEEKREKLNPIRIIRMYY